MSRRRGEDGADRARDGEPPRWHEGPPWLSGWSAQEILAVDLAGSREVVVSGAEIIHSWPCIHAAWQVAVARWTLEKHGTANPGIPAGREPAPGGVAREHSL